MSGLITSRRVSLVIALAYTVVVLIAGAGRPLREVLGTLLPIAGYLILPLACIWYGDEMGDYVGILPGPAINRTTPGWLVKLAGWFLLFFPVMIVLLVWLTGYP